MKFEIIKILEINIHNHHLDILYGLDDFHFSTKIFYHDVSFPTLISRYSEETINSVIAYIALFEGMKLCSLFPVYYDISIISKWLSPSIKDVFYKIFNGVFAQHLYENKITDYMGPQIIPELNNKVEFSERKLCKIDGNATLMPCGGGKDSFLAMKIFQEANLPFASMQYSHSVYGKGDIQHNYIDEVIKYLNPIKKHKISIFDDFINSPFIDLYTPTISGITVPETPVSIFESLILMLNFNYPYLSLAHERSANTGNMFSKELGKEVNHQWGKSYEAEIILNTFIRKNIISNFLYFSILQPIYDFRIFKNLTKYPEIITKIHSCNIQKPWCKKCPKCAYVWLGLVANFDIQLINSIFNTNLFDDSDLISTFREMLGLAEHTPFECIGEINETRLFMKKCVEKGLEGKVLDIFKNEILSDNSIDWVSIEQKYSKLYEIDHAIPVWIFDQIKKYL